MFKILKSMGRFQLIEVEGDRRDQVYDTGLSKRLQMCLFMLPKNVPTTKKKSASKALRV
jgi:hypothetical protein